MDDVKESSDSMKEEALIRMRMLGLNPDIIYLYKKNGKLCCSDKGNITDIPDNILKEIKDWENEYGNTIYHIIHADFMYETYECLSVSCYKEDWNYERNLIHDKWVMSHSINITIPNYTESGSIRFENNNGTLIRTL